MSRVPGVLAGGLHVSAFWVGALCCGSSLARASGAGTGALVLEVVLKGPASPPQKITPTTDSAICGLQNLVTEDLIVDPKTKRVRNVVAWVEGSSGPVGEGVVIDNFRCRYDPHVSVVQVNEPVTVRNRDRFLHTSAAKSEAGRTVFNVALATHNQARKKKFKAIGFYQLGCDVHPWMNAWAVVLQREIAGISDKTGEIHLRGVRSGQRTLRLWHEKLGQKRVQLNVPIQKTLRHRVEWPVVLSTP